MEIPLSRGCVAIVDDDDYERVSKFKWSCHTLGYAYRGYTLEKKYMAQYLHRFILNEPNGIVDHINHNKLDCRKINLRVTDKSGNAHNREGNPDCVHWDRSRNKWVAKIKVRGKYYFIGRFGSRDDAIKARREAESIYIIPKAMCSNN